MVPGAFPWRGCEAPHRHTPSNLYAMLPPLLRIGLALTLGITLSASSAASAPIEVRFDADVGTATGVFARQGAQLHGYYRFDGVLVDIHPEGSLLGTIWDHFVLEDPSSPFWISITVGAATRSTQDNLNLHPQHHSIFIQDSDIDAWALGARKESASDDFVMITALDRSPEDMADAISPGSGGLSSVLRLTPGNLALFDDLAGRSTYTAYDSQGALEGEVRFTLTSVEVVSEPASFPWLAILGLLGSHRFNGSQLFSRSRGHFGACRAT